MEWNFDQVKPENEVIVRFPMTEHPDNIGVCGCGCGQEVERDGQVFVLNELQGNEALVTTWRPDCLEGKASIIPNGTLRYSPSRQRWVIGAQIVLYQRNQTNQDIGG